MEEFMEGVMEVVVTVVEVTDSEFAEFIVIKRTGGCATSGCDKKSILFTINQLVLVLVFEIITALFF